MGLPRSTYYDAPSRKADDAEIIATMMTICDEFEVYGYRRVGAELRHRDIIVNSKKVRRLMREHDLRPKRRRRFMATTDSDHDIRSFRILRVTGSSTARTSSGWRTSPTSQSPPASSTWPPSSTPGRAEWWDMRSAVRSTHAWRLQR